MDIYDIVKKLKPCEFKYNWEDKKTLGFIAQDLLEVFPENEYTIVKKDKERLLLYWSNTINFFIMFVYTKTNRRKGKIKKWSMY